MPAEHRDAGSGPSTSYGDWQVLDRIGAGGMATVYRAVGPDGTPAALKVVRAKHRDRQAWKRECVLLERLSHPSIVRLLDFGENAADSWLAMEYVPGLSAAALRDQRPQLMSPAVVARIGSTIAGALDYAHNLRTVHRDVKPGNILITVGADGALDRVVLGDFGIAEPLASEPDTSTNAAAGTIGYTAPERLHGHPPVPASDQYSLAVTLFALLCGRLPFAGGSVAALVHNQLTGTPEPISQHARVPSPADAVFQRALSIDPSHRYRSCSDFTAALTTALGVPTNDRARPEPDSALYEATQQPVQAAPARRRFGGPFAVAGATAATLMAVVGAVFVPHLVGSSTSSEQDARMAAAAQLCTTLPSVHSPQAGFKDVTNPRPVYDVEWAGDGCLVSADLSITDTPERRDTVIGYSKTRPPGATDFTRFGGSEPVTYYYLADWTQDGHRMCLWGYPVTVGYLNLQAPLVPDQSCDEYRYSLVALQVARITSPAARR